MTEADNHYTIFLSVPNYSRRVSEVRLILKYLFVSKIIIKNLTYYLKIKYKRIVVIDVGMRAIHLPLKSRRFKRKQKSPAIISGKTKIKD